MQNSINFHIFWNRLCEKPYCCKSSINIMEHFESKHPNDEIPFDFSNTRNQSRKSTSKVKQVCCSWANPVKKKKSAQNFGFNFNLPLIKFKFKEKNENDVIILTGCGLITHYKFASIPSIEFFLLFID